MELQLKINKDEVLVSNWKSFRSEEAFKEAAKKYVDSLQPNMTYNFFYNSQEDKGAVITELKKETEVTEKAFAEEINDSEKINALAGGLVKIKEAL